MNREKTQEMAGKAVRKFIDRATSEERAWYLARGEAGAIRLGNPFETPKEPYAPSLRGVIVEKPVKTIETAIAIAQGRREEFAKAPQTPVDEREQCIDERTADIARGFAEANLQMETIVHIGTMGNDSGSHTVRDLITDAIERKDCDARRDLPILAKLATEEPLNIECILDELRYQGYLGFLVEASVAMIKPTGQGAAIIHRSRRATNIFYHPTYEGACERAIAWAKTKTDEMMTAKPDPETS